MKKTCVIIALFAIALGAFAQSEDDFEISQNKNGKITITGYTGKAQNIVIPAAISGVAVDTIGDGAFKNKDILSITIPNSVTTIGQSAFAENKLTRVILPDSVTTLDGNAFADNSITEIVWSKNLTSIPYGAFHNNKLTKLSVPNGVKVIEGDFLRFDPDLGGGGGAFSKNEISELSLPPGLEEIGAAAFSYNKIIKLNLPKSLKRIGGGVENAGAFSNNKISEVTFPNGITTVEEGAFDNNQIVVVRLPMSNFLENNRPKDRYSGEYWYMFTDNPNTGGRYNLSHRFVDTGNHISGIRIPEEVADEILETIPFEEGFTNFYISQGRKEGIYVKKGRIWTTGTEADLANITKQAEEQAAAAEKEYQERLEAWEQRKAAVEQYNRAVDAENEKLQTVYSRLEKIGQLKKLGKTDFAEFKSIYRGFKAIDKGKLAKETFMEEKPEPGQKTQVIIGKKYNPPSGPIRSDAYTGPAPDSYDGIENTLNTIYSKLSRSQKKDFDKEFGR